MRSRYVVRTSSEIVGARQAHLSKRQLETDCFHANIGVNTGFMNGVNKLSDTYARYNLG